MKKISKLILIIIITCISILCISIFTEDEYYRLRHMEDEISQDKIYLTGESIESSKLLDKFNDLSDKYKVSIVKTTVTDSYNKLLMINEDTFPYDRFGGYFDKDDLPKNLPVFMNIEKLMLVDMKSYYDLTGESINGEYTLVSNADYDKEGFLDELSYFLSTSKNDLTEKKYGSGYTYINNTSIFSSVAIIVFLLALILISVYHPLVNMDKIGIFKLLGIKEFDILKSYMLPNILTIIITSIILDMVIYILNSYIPEKFFTILILMQLAMLLVYILVSFFISRIIKHITISNMINKFVSMKWIHFVNFALKIGVTIFTVGALFLLGESFNLTFNSLKQADFYTRKSPDYLTGEFIDESNARMTINSQEYVKIPYDAYKNMVKNIDDVNYICYQKFEPYWKNRSFEKGKFFEVLNVNANYLKKLGFKIHNGKNVIYVPSYMKDDNIEEIFSYFFYQTNDVNNIDERRLKDIKIDIYYYDRDLETITYDEDKLLVKNPIINLVDDMNMNHQEMLGLTVTGINNSIKIKNTKENREKIEKIYGKYNGEYHMKFSSISSIFSERLDEYRSLLLKVLSVIFSLTLLTIFISFFIIEGYFLTEKRYVHVTKLLGHKFVDRFNIIFILIGLIDLIAFVALAFISKNPLILAIFAILFLIDVLQIIGFIKVKDKKNLSSNLKGA